MESSDMKMQSHSCEISQISNNTFLTSFPYAKLRFVRPHAEDIGEREIFGAYRCIYNDVIESLVKSHLLIDKGDDGVELRTPTPILDLRHALMYAIGEIPVERLSSLIHLHYTFFTKIGEGNRREPKVFPDLFPTITMESIVCNDIARRIVNGQVVFPWDLKVAKSTAICFPEDDIRHPENRTNPFIMQYVNTKGDYPVFELHLMGFAPDRYPNSNIDEQPTPRRSVAFYLKCDFTNDHMSPSQDRFFEDLEKETMTMKSVTITDHKPGEDGIITFKYSI